MKKMVTSLIKVQHFDCKYLLLSSLLETFSDFLAEKINTIDSRRYFMKL
jgi:hypothetical protein